MDRPARPDDGSPARLIAAMVGIVGILLLGSLAWSAVGALFSALGEATSVISPVVRPTPINLALGNGTSSAPSRTAGTRAQPGPIDVKSAGTPTAGALAPPRAVTPGDVTPGAVTPGAVTPGAVTPGALATGVTAAATIAPPPPPTLAPTSPTSTVVPTAAGTPTPAAEGRAPWILLPQPEPGAHVAPGPMVIEARGRGDAAITAIRLELDGAPLSVSLEQRSESTWRGFASARLTPGQHNVRATVIDETGRSGGYRWSFEAGP